MMSGGQNFVCRVCGGYEVKAYTIKEMMFGWKDSFAYMECNACGCLQIENYVDDIARYYPEDYYSFKPIEEDKYKPKGLRAHLKRFLIRANQLYLGNLLAPLFGKAISPNYDKFEYLKIVNPMLNDSVLDIGCGRGSHLCKLFKIGFTNLTGVDKYISKSDVLLGRIKILKLDLEDIKEKYDLIMMHHVLEHMPNQVIELKKVNKLLNKNGKIIIRIPVKAKAWEMYKENWVQLDAPRHYYLHTRRSLERVANDAGLRVDKVVFDSTVFQFWGSEQYKGGISLYGNDISYYSNEKAFDADVINSWETMAKELNMKNEGDQAIFVLRSK